MGLTHKQRNNLFPISIKYSMMAKGYKRHLFCTLYQKQKPVLHNEHLGKNLSCFDVCKYPLFSVEKKISKHQLFISWLFSEWNRLLENKTCQKLQTYSFASRYIYAIISPNHKSLSHPWSTNIQSPHCCTKCKTDRRNSSQI